MGEAEIPQKPYELQRNDNICRQSFLLGDVTHPRPLGLHSIINRKSLSSNVFVIMKYELMPSSYVVHLTQKRNKGRFWKAALPRTAALVDYPTTALLSQVKTAKYCCTGAVHGHRAASLRILGYRINDLWDYEKRMRYILITNNGRLVTYTSNNQSLEISRQETIIPQLRC